MSKIILHALVSLRRMEDIILILANQLRWIHSKNKLASQRCKRANNLSTNYVFLVKKWLIELDLPRRRLIQNNSILYFVSHNKCSLQIIVFALKIELVEFTKAKRQTEIDIGLQIDWAEEVFIDVTWLGIVVLLIQITGYEWFVYCLSLWVLQICYWIFPV